MQISFLKNENANARSSTGLPNPVCQLDVHVVRLVPAVLPAHGAQFLRRLLHSGAHLTTTIFYDDIIKKARPFKDIYIVLVKRNSVLVQFS